MNSDELRDRIAGCLSNIYGTGQVLDVDTRAAQAIIDGLGLTVEGVWRTDEDGAGTSPHTRVVGRWEEGE